MFNADLITLLLVSIVAIILGTAFARQRHKPDQYWLKRNVCPHCRARKLLQHTPLSDVAFVTTCRKCEQQWHTQATDMPEVPQIIMPIGRRNWYPELRFFWSQQTQNPVFKTFVGEVEFDAIGLVRDHGLNADTPRDLLAALYHHGIEPSREEYNKPEFDYKYFIESAGIDSDDRKKD